MASNKSDFFKKIIQVDDTAIVSLTMDEGMSILCALEDGSLVTDQGVRLVPNYEEQGYVLCIDVTDLPAISNVLNGYSDDMEMEAGDEVIEKKGNKTEKIKIERLAKRFQESVVVADTDCKDSAIGGGSAIQYSDEDGAWGGFDEADYKSDFDSDDLESVD